MITPFEKILDRVHQIHHEVREIKERVRGVEAKLAAGDNRVVQQPSLPEGFVYPLSAIEDLERLDVALGDATTRQSTVSCHFVLNRQRFCLQ
jgi:hypothetical protein